MNLKRWLLLTFIGAGIVSFTGGVFIGRAIFVPSVPAKAVLFSNLRTPANTLTEALGVIMNKSPDDVSQVDPATMYLASLADMPGAENIDLDHARAHFDDLARLVGSQTVATSKYQHSINKNFKDTPESLAITLADVLRKYERDADLRMDSNRPETLFLKNHIAETTQSQFASPEAALAARLRDYGPPPQDNLPGMQPKVDPMNNPILILIVGRLLGYPLFLVKAPDRYFVRWQSPDEKTEFNIDEVGKDGESIADEPFRPDSDYDRPPDSQVKEGGYFKSLTPLELQAFFLKQRGDYLSAHQSLFDAELAFTAAHRFAPDTPLYDEDMRSVLAEEMKFVGMTWQELEKSCPDYFNLSPPKPDNSIIP